MVKREPYNLVSEVGLSGQFLSPLQSEIAQFRTWILL